MDMRAVQTAEVGAIAKVRMASRRTEGDEASGVGEGACLVRGMSQVADDAEELRARGTLRNVESCWRW